MSYLENVNFEVCNYFRILEPCFPCWMEEYINTTEMLRLHDISVTCGTIYSDLFESDFFFSTLDHSVAVALIVWHFTHDKKQALAGLFHDIATPIFKHCVDFLNGDYMTQESTEDLTTEIISNSEEIMSLLNRDKILVNEVDNYHLYPIADNDTPKLSADRLEYSLSNGLFTYKMVNLNEVESFYDDISIQKNEEGLVEMAFNTQMIARVFVKMTSELSILYRADKTRYSMQFLADLLKKLSDEGKICKKDLYLLKEQDVIGLIESSNYARIFNQWRTAKQVKTSSSKPNDVYSINLGAKVRYIDPLVEVESGVCKRGSIIDSEIKRMIDENLSYDMNKYVYLDFDF